MSAGHGPGTGGVTAAPVEVEDKASTKLRYLAPGIPYADCGPRYGRDDTLVLGGDAPPKRLPCRNLRDRPFRDASKSFVLSSPSPLLTHRGLGISLTSYRILPARTPQKMPAWCHLRRYMYPNLGQWQNSGTGRNAGVNSDVRGSQ